MGVKQIPVFPLFIRETNLRRFRQQQNLNVLANQ